MVKLKPCPFCGGEPTLEQNNSTKKWWVYCSNPKRRINPSTDMHIVRAVIVREWNRRVDMGRSSI